MRSFLVSLSATLASVVAHATFQQVWVNDVDQGSWCARLPASNTPVSNVGSADLACNATPGKAHGNCMVAAGDKVTVEMHQQPGDRSCKNEAIGGAHYGPVIVYMAKVTDAATASGANASWVKVSQMGLPSNNPNYWATQVLNDNCGHYTFTVPKDLAPGDYLLRAEAIALHAASSSGGAQFYMTCFQFTVSSEGTAKPAGVSIPGAYKASDPGILVALWTVTNYVIPGPTAYNQASPTIASTAWPKTATWNTASQPATVPAGPPPGNTLAPGNSAPDVPAETSTAAGPTQTKYGQCGGQDWKGPTLCEAGSTCTSSGPYFSQCV